MQKRLRSLAKAEKKKEETKEIRKMFKEVIDGIKEEMRQTRKKIKENKIDIIEALKRQRS